MGARKVVLSDIGDVVVYYDNGRTVEALAPYCSLPPEEVRRVLFSKADNGLAWDYCRGDLDTETFRRVAMNKVGCVGRCSDEEFDLAFRQIFTLNDDVVNLWKKLRNRGVSITAVSDVEEMRHWELQKLGVMDLFDNAVLSYIEREVKPSEHMIRKALEVSGVRPNEAVFIDDKADHLPPAEALGVMTHHYKEFGDLREFLKVNGVG
ncbi:MAG: HAD-IA family hydrolase [Patescibacteria group bacterium]|nr:HAD-IA family hydrolase [Patescibacteria group bacterium]